VCCNLIYTPSGVKWFGYMCCWKKEFNMCDKSRHVSLGFTDVKYPAGTHMCLLYNDEKERREVIAKYLQYGLLSNEKVNYFADNMTPLEVITWLENMDVNLPRDKQNLQFAVSPAIETYCPDSSFHFEEMIARLKKYYANSIGEGFIGCRVSGEMSWALKNIPGTENLIEYESQVNTMIDSHPITAICQYNVDQFNGEFIFDVLQVHPFLIVHGQLINNPTYVKPAEYINKNKEKYFNNHGK